MVSQLQLQVVVFSFGHQIYQFVFVLFIIKMNESEII